MCCSWPVSILIAMLISSCDDGDCCWARVNEQEQRAASRVRAKYTLVMRIFLSGFFESAQAFDPIEFRLYLGEKLGSYLFGITIELKVSWHGGETCRRTS